MTFSKWYLFLTGLISSIAMNASAGNFIKDHFLTTPVFYVGCAVVLFFINSYILHYFLSIRIGTAAWRYMVVGFLSVIPVAILLGLFTGISYALMIKFGFKVDYIMEIWQSYVVSLISALVIIVIQYYFYKRIFDPLVNKANLKKALVCICFLNMMSNPILNKARRLFVAANQDDVVIDELKIVNIQKDDQSNSDLIDDSGQELAKK